MAQANNEQKNMRSVKAEGLSLMLRVCPCFTVRALPVARSIFDAM